MRIRNRSKASQLDDDTRCTFRPYVLNYGCFLGRGIPNLGLGSDSSFIRFSLASKLARCNSANGNNFWYRSSA